MEQRRLPSPICTLKADISCCTVCQVKAKKRLQKLDGVDSITYDTKQGLVIVSGNVDPMLLVEKFEKWGKKAELWSFQKDPLQNTPNKKNCAKTGCPCPVDSDSSSDSDSNTDSDSDSDHKHRDDNYDLRFPRRRDAAYPLQPPDLTDVQSSKGSKKCFFRCLFGKKDDKAKELGNAASALNDARKWHFPKLPMPDYGAAPPMLYHPMYDERPRLWNQPYGPSLYGRSAPPYPFYSHRPMMPLPPRLPPPQGFFPSRSPPRINPMIHYTSYEDNYYPYP